ncbi:MAG: hypothetical protein FWG09_06400 [Synergistaceae bacterium]|nr:hypothetical protein [Synergistaceae bacterium]
MNDLMNEFKEALEAEKLITARLVDSVARGVQLASSVTPEMRELFEQWVSFIASQVMREASGCEIDIPAVAKKIGVKESSLLSLVLYMQRNGGLNVQKVTFTKGNGENEEICNCLKGDE